MTNRTTPTASLLGDPADPITTVAERINNAVDGVPLAIMIAALCRMLAVACLHANHPESAMRQVPLAIAGHFALVQRAVAKLRGARMH